MKQLLLALLKRDGVEGGTPKTLDDAVTIALCVGPLSDVRDRSYFVLKDFLSQRFGAAMLAHPECDKVLKELFENIVRRQK